ncbi:MAG: SH3 domain-containing protein [Bacillota bacterium]
MKLRFISLGLAFLLLFSIFPAPAFARDALKNTDSDKYYILLDTNNQIVTVYERDENGEYTRIVRRFLCSSGRTEIDPEIPDDQGTPTPRGIWKIGGRERFGKFAAFSGEYARYWTQIVGSVYFHSIMFSRRDVDTLKSSPYRNLGRNVSHGCVRLYVEDAKWLYYYACPGTVIKVSHSEPDNPELRRALKSKLSFSDYNALQKGIYDAGELPNYTAWTVVDGADMRTGNGSNDGRIARLKLGTAVEILQVGDPWCKIKYNKREGYIRTAYLTFEQGEMQSEEDADILRGTTYLQQEPGSGAVLLFKVPAYTSVKVLDSSNEDWWRVEVWGVEGYLPARVLTKGWGLMHD